jgi:hypothetical protein
LDTYKGQFDFAKHSTQTHDFNPGFGPPVSGHGSVFWTVAIPDSDVQVHLGAARAEMHVRNLAVEDYFNLPNALADGPEVDATVSFDVIWSGPITRRLNFQNSTAIDPFAGEFVENHVTVSWSGSNANGFSFTSNPGDFSTSVDPFSELSKDRNGRFFTGSGGGGQASALPVGNAHSSVVTTPGDHAVATLLASLVATRSLTAPIPAGNGIPTPPATAPSASHSPLLLNAGSQSSTPSSGTQHMIGSSTAALDYVFAAIAVNPLDHGTYQGLFTDPASP